MSGSTPLAFALDASTNEVVLSSADLRSDVLDNCDSNPAITLSRTNFTCADLGTQTITITATDDSGNQSTATEDIIIRDATAPTFMVINPTLELDANGSYTLKQADIVTDLSDNCSAAANITVTFNPTTFSCANLGTSDFDFTVADESGNVANASSSITIVDRIAPVVNTQDLTITLGQNGTVTVDPSQVDDGTSDNCSFTLSLDKSTFTTADIGANTVTLTATDVGGNTASATAVVTVEEVKDPQTITFSLQDDATYGDAPIVLSATASSGLAVTYTVTGSGELINGNELQINGAGDIVVTASQIGDGTYESATEIVETLSVAKANLTAKAEDVTITYGSNDLLSFSITFSGFIGDDDALDIDQISTAGSVGRTSSDAGAYPITISAGSDNDYSFTYVEGTFTIEKADQTVTFPAIANMDLASTTSVFLSAVSDAGLPILYTLAEGASIASISGTEVTLSGTGLVTIEATQMGTNNYNSAPALQQSFEVIDSRKQDQTITLSTVSNVTYGDAPITLSATASSGLNVIYTYVDGPATLAGNVVMITGAGTVNIEVSQDGNSSFNAAIAVIQSFAVAPARITITPDNQQILRDQTLPVFTFSYTGFENGDTESDLDQLPTVGSPSADIATADTYPIVVTQDAIDANYVFTNEEGILTVKVPLSVNHIAINIFPNPATDKIRVEGLSLQKIELIDMAGKIVKTVLKNQSLYVNDLKSGVYYLRIHSDELPQPVTRKIMLNNQ